MTRPVPPEILSEILRDPDGTLYPCGITIFCDFCGREAPGQYLVDAEMTATERYDVARRHLAANQGWRVNAEGEDVCPAHPDA